VDLAVFVVREHRHGRSIEKLRKLLIEPEAGDLRNPVSQLLKVSDALGLPVVDQRTATAYVRVLLRSYDPGLTQTERRSMRLLCRSVREALLKRSAPRGRKVALSRRQREHVREAYRTLLAFFKQPSNRPAPANPRDRALLERINQQLAPFQPSRVLALDNLSDLTEETAPNRLAKLAVGFAFGVSPGFVEKTIIRRP